ncbi:SusC/RagA family TonB-linked outer membrane protein [Parapedobacter lycopersici]|uniref:SusC/RagA family TonB-linked outer membrane protein n=1 Tax=Parapedobacter lycopersici TaxID=1864939 RepID=UPI00214DA781|nr:SusC/RagA family TonB-linked outer membrane protein [Parapedobacter lycopersici]
MKYFTRRITGAISLNYRPEDHHRKEIFIQLMRVGFILMAIVLISLQLLLATPVKSQKITQVEITFGLKHESLLAALKEIEQQTPFRFVYRMEDLSAVSSKGIGASTYTVKRALDLLLGSSGFSYKQMGNNILIKATGEKLAVRALHSPAADNTVADITIKGRVSDSTGRALAGVSIKVKGTPTEVTTDQQGQFTISVPGNSSSLIFSYIGYNTKEVAVNNQTVIDVVLETANTALNEVVVTALGISRERKALAYAVSEVKGEEFTRARENNIANALTGKIAGVNATGMASGPGGSSRVIIRGNGSLSGNNQPLYVINGMPMNNVHREQAQGEGSTLLDRGDGIAAINPDDIESINVLKGGPAAALYGSQAANGVILITTKKGAIRQGVGVEVNSNFVVGSPSMYPEFQYIYGQGLDGRKPETQAEAISSGRLSFGARIDGAPYMQFDGVMRPYSAVQVKDNWKNFYRPSTNFTNTIAFSGGSSSALVYRLSLSDLEAQALEPGSHYNRRTANLNLQSVLGERITVEATFQYNFEGGKNRPGNGYADNTTSWATNLLANTVDIRSLAPGYDEHFNEVQWQQVPEAQNPYFVINRMGNKDSKNRFIGQGSIQYNVADNLFLKVSGMRDIDRFESMDYMPIGTAKRPRGLFNSGTSFVTKTTGQLLLNYNTELLRNVDLNLMVGGNMERNTTESANHNGSEFIVPDFISFSNLAIQSTTVGFSQYGQNSLFGSADLGYKGMLYLTFTGRQDWFSTLNPGNNSIFYPSVGTSFVLSDAFTLPKAISFAKLRLSWAQVGGATVNPYQINQLYTFEQGGHLGRPVLNTSSALSNPDLRPLTSTTYEGGIDIQFLNNRLGLDFTYYNRKTTDDILSTSIAASSGYTTALMNVGELSNRGIELLVSGQPVRSERFTWDVSYNMAYNKSEILKLAPGLSTVGGAGVGSPYNTLRGRTYLTNESGQRVYNKLSGYEVQGPEIEYGTGVPPYTMGFTNNFRYGNFSLNILIDGKFGNIVQSGLSRYMYRFGLSKATLPGREGGLTVSGVDEDGAPFTKTWPVEQLDTYYNNQASISPLTTSVFDGSFIKLRSAVLTYRLPADKLRFLKAQTIDFSIVARNLAILYKKITDFDPESSYTVGNDQGHSSNTIPRTREIGLNLIVKF